MPAKPRDKAAIGDRGQEILDMFASIPVELLHERAMELLSATRHVSQGRDLPMVEEPDNAVRLKVWQTIIEQQAGAAGSRKPVEVKPVAVDDAAPGKLLA